VAAYLRPSFSGVWGHCSGAPLASQMVTPRPPNARTIEGTAAHWVASQTMRALRGEVASPTACHGYVGKQDPDRTIVTEEIAEGAQYFVDEMGGLCGGDFSQVLLDHPVHAVSIHPTHCSGELDAAIVRRDAAGEVTAIIVRDYKHGHRATDAVDQLNVYGLGVYDDVCGLHSVDDREVRFSFGVVQPFAFDGRGILRERNGVFSDLRADRNTLALKAEQAVEGGTLTTGAHCRDCPAIGSCSSARAAGYNLIDVAGSRVILDDMSAPDLAAEREILKAGGKVLQERLDGIEALLTQRLQRGEAVPGLGLASTRGRLKWTTTPAVARAMASQFGFDIATDAVKTPKQSIDAAPKAVRPFFESAIKTISERPSGSMKITDADNTVCARAFQRKQ